ncbi:MAG: Thioredoxin domain [Pseudolabrys sp.]|jgi:thiol-disulfide isomerase/thioredoxin|nr:Thioredoxin domain [Pseudolabrys sp.]
MLNRRTLIGAVATGALLAAGTVAFATTTAAPYSQRAFDAAQSAGKPILLHVTAPWCPTCRAQKPILSVLESQPKYKDMVAQDIDFDTSKDLLRRLHVTQQSTLIVYKGKTEVGRSTGDTDMMSIEALLDKAV